MKRSKYLYIALFSALAGLALLTPAGSAGNTVHHITLDDDIINPVSAEYITSAIDKAEAGRASCLIIELDTPGGLLTSTRTIVKKMMNANVPVVVYVGPKGARAGSAGVFITLAANVAAMAPSTNIGAAHPVQIDERKSDSDPFEELMKRLLTKEEDKKKKKGKVEKNPVPPMQQKILNDTVAWAETIAKNRGRNVEWARKAVEESVSVTEDEALRLKIIDIVAKDTQELITKLDGREVTLPSGKSVIETKDATVVDVPKNFRLRWLMVLAHPNIAYILLMFGIYGLMFEFTHPGIAFPGIGGAICLILAFFGLQVLPTNYAGIALIVLALGMFVAEIKVTSYGLLTIGGVIALFFGSLILFSSPYEFMRVSIPMALSFSLATLAVATFLTYIVVKSRGKKAMTGIEGLEGEHGVIRSCDGLHGKVFVHGELWDYESDAPLNAGTAVEVMSVNGMTLKVKPKEAI